MKFVYLFVFFGVISAQFEFSANFFSNPTQQITPTKPTTTAAATATVTPPTPTTVATQQQELQQQQQQQQQYYTQIPAYGPQSEILSVVGSNYPSATQQQQTFRLLKEYALAEDGNQFKRIHSELQKNNEVPVVVSAAQYTPSPTLVTAKYPKLFEGYERFETGLLKPNSGLEKTFEEYNVDGFKQEEQDPATTYGIIAPKYAAPVDLSGNYAALNEHQLNTEKQLHRLIHAMDMITESIDDPLRDEYQRGINEMLAKHLQDPHVYRDSSVYQHLNNDHRFYTDRRTPDLGERVAKQLFNGQTVPAVPETPTATVATVDKDQLRQKTVEQNQVRPL